MIFATDSKTGIYREKRIITIARRTVSGAIRPFATTSKSEIQLKHDGWMSTPAIAPLTVLHYSIMFTSGAGTKFSAACLATHE